MVLIQAFNGFPLLDRLPSLSPPPHPNLQVELHRRCNDYGEVENMTQDG